MPIEGWEPPVAIAHRGSRLLWPENTMLAFGAVVELGYSHIETDLRLTADNVVVCIHDPLVDRTTDGEGSVADFDFADLSALDAGFRHRSDGYPFRGAGVSVPRLEDVVQEFLDVRLVVELKEDRVVGPLVELISKLELEDRLIVGSYSDARLAEFHGLSSGQVPMSMGWAGVAGWALAARFGRPARGRARALQVPMQWRGVQVVTPRFLGLAHELGRDVHVWTVNDPKDMSRLLDLGVDGLITDRPDVLKAVLQGRGQWKTQ